MLGPEQVVFRRDRLLHLDDELRVSVQGRRIRQNLDAVRGVDAVRITALFSGPGLQIHLIPGTHQFPGGIGDRVPHVLQEV